MSDARKAMRFAIVLIALLIPLCSSCARDEAPPEKPAITVFAAASTADLVTAFAQRYEAQTGVRVRCSFAASSTLARQIAHGAQADVYLSANPLWMDYLQANGLIEPDTRRDLLTNRIVLITPKDAPLSIEISPGGEHAIAIGERVAIGDPEHTPAGIYARQALEHLGWWDEVDDRLIPAVDVRAALRLVELGEADAGIVYATDAASSTAVTIIAAFPPESHDPIRYPVALCREASPAARAFLDDLAAPQAAELITSFGFDLPPR